MTFLGLRLEEAKEQIRLPHSPEASHNLYQSVVPVRRQLAQVAVPVYRILYARFIASLHLFGHRNRHSLGLQQVFSREIRSCHARFIASLHLFGHRPNGIRGSACKAVGARHSDPPLAHGACDKAWGEESIPLCSGSAVRGVCCSRMSKTDVARRPMWILPVAVRREEDRGSAASGCIAGAKIQQEIAFVKSFWEKFSEKMRFFFSALMKCRSNEPLSWVLDENRSRESGLLAEVP